MHNFFEKYLKIRDEVDKMCSVLWKLHNPHMKCKIGCVSCCQAFRLLPIEFHAIRQTIKKDSVQINNNLKNGECKFLVNNKCSIYNQRPIICRTHGYPLYRLNDEVEAYEISYCPLNFKDYVFQNFNADNMYPEDKFNSKVFILNKEFIRNYTEESYDPLELVGLNNI